MSLRTDPSFVGAVASPHHLATAAAEAVLGEGGSAVDAALTAAAVLTVVYPHNVSIGGDLIALVRSPDGVLHCINASGRTPAAQTADRLRAKHGDALPVRGIDTVTVPGAVRGWERLHVLGGRLPWSRCFDEAVGYAEDGVEVASDLAASIAEEEPLLTADAGAGPIFSPSGRALVQGDLLVQPALAVTLRRLQASGADEFYTGAVARDLIAGLRAAGSLLSEEDFADFAPEIVPPLTGDFRGLQVHTSPPNTHGFVLLRALQDLEALGIAEDALGSELGALERIFRDANAVRDEHLADPAFGEVDVSDLLSRLPGPGAGPQKPDFQRPAGDTVGIAAIDAEGWAVSLIQSVFFAFGSGILEPTTGILLHNRGTSFSLSSSSANRFEPRKRPLHTLMPVLVTEGDSPRFVLATQGGQGQPQIHAQLLLRLLAGATPEEAVRAPRAIVGVREFDAAPDTVFAEQDLPAEAMASIERSGLPVHRLPPHSELLGQANVIAVTDDGVLAASDPRADGSAVVLSGP
ncbi:MAG: gamma-glutamyltranspeptidase [Naasia sp.]|jgi:gamma-glutamyltranspeptidase|uniref:gamma-glutamyltransferase family protein n=1 Tax=Naasia sp. TaxID=2546198 RepID=UPI0026141825|nr:gamma-glutamyltransferase [Naasia sp.]MCU1570881.1 gamma-glutamyltranspeptidase [Naasia sp.]